MSTSSPSIPFLLLTTAYLNAKSVPALISPRLTMTLLAPTSRPPTEVEGYLCRSIALALLILVALAVAEVITLSSDVDSSSSSSSSSSSPAPVSRTSASTSNNPTSGNKPTSPPASPLVLALAAFHALSFLHAYISYTSAYGQGSATLAPSSPNTSLLLLDASCSGFLSAYGLWVIVFGADKHISRRTGRDKRTSGWPFGKGDRERKRR